MLLFSSSAVVASEAMKEKRSSPCLRRLFLTSNSTSERGFDTLPAYSLKERSHNCWIYLFARIVNLSM